MKYIVKLKWTKRNRPIRLIQCCTQFKSPGAKILCVLYLHYNVAFTFKWYGNSLNKTFYSQRVLIGYNIELAEKVNLLFGCHFVFTSLTMFISSFYNYNINQFITLEKNTHFQVSVWKVKFLFVRRFRDISVQKVTYTQVKFFNHKFTTRVL